MPRKAEPHPYRSTSTRYTDPNGRRCKKGTPGATSHTEQSRVYVADLPRAGGGTDRKVSLGTANLGAAWVRLRELLDGRRRAAEGLADPLLVQARRPLAEHVEEWGRVVAVSGCKPRHAALVLSRVRKLVEVAGWTRLADLTEDSLLAALDELGRSRTKSMRKRYEGRGQQTRGHYIAAVKQFAHWALAGGRLATNPFARVRRPATIREPRQARRLPSDAEVARLLAWLEGQSRTRRKVTPQGRGLLYRLAMATGFRSGELRSLTRARFDLDAGTVTCRTAYSKNGRLAVFPLPPWLLAEFRDWFARDGALWGHLNVDGPGKVLQADLAAAGIPYEVETPEGPAYWDFHAMRHWFISWAARQPGMSPKALLTLSRHSDPRLTLATYAKTRDGEVAGHLAGLEIPGRTPGRTESADPGVHCRTPEQWWLDRECWPEG